jgi:mRNA interferase MazF
MVEGAEGLKRGEIWTVAGGADYVGKPHPAIIIQSDDFDSTPSITVCPLTTAAVKTVYARFAISPSAVNGLETDSHAMVDKISTIPKIKSGRRIGKLDAEDILRLNTAIALFLGLADRHSP